MKVAGHKGRRVGGQEEHVGEENWVWIERSESFCSVLRLLVHPSFLVLLLTFADESEEGSRIKGGGFTVTLLLAFVFGRSSLPEGSTIQYLTYSAGIVCVASFVSTKELRFRHFSVNIKLNCCGIASLQSNNHTAAKEIRCRVDL